jgi:hypothetical protein
MQQRVKRGIKWSVLAGVCVVLAGGAWFGQRAFRVADAAWNVEQQVRYMVENDGQIGAAAAADTFSDRFLEIIFGDNPDLLAKLKVVIRRGLEEDPNAEMGEVAAMLVTYRINNDGTVYDVAAQIIGGFPLSEAVPGMSRDGLMSQKADPELWSIGNSTLRFLGRDMILFADESVSDAQLEIIDGIFSGNILPLAESLNDPLFYTMVLPNPRNIVPPRLRTHIQAIMQSGYLSPYEGTTEFVILTTSSRSADYAASVINDTKRLAEKLLRTRMGGSERETEWGTMVDAWWAKAMADTSQAMAIERDGNVIRLNAEFDRVMVNALLKTVERFGRDWAQIQQRLNGREGAAVAAQVAELQATAQEAASYWSDGHIWGPNWPVAASAGENEELERARAAEAAAMEATTEVKALIRAEEQARLEAERAAREAERLAAEEAARQAAEEAAATETPQ